MAKKYRIEHTEKEVQTVIGTDIEVTLADVTVVWDDEEGIGLELPPHDGIVAKRGTNPFATPEGKEHAKDVVREITKYILDNKLYEQNNSDSEP
jgi:hypothetical protein